MRSHFKTLSWAAALVVAAVGGRITATSPGSSQAAPSHSCEDVAIHRDGSVWNGSSSAVTVVYSVLGATQDVNKYAGSVKGVDGDFESMRSPRSFQPSNGLMARVRGVLVVPPKSVASVGLYAPRLWTSNSVTTDTGPLPAHLIDFISPALESCTALEASGSDRFASSLVGVVDACEVSDLVAVQSGSNPPVIGGSLSPNALAGAIDVCSFTSSAEATREWLSKRNVDLDAPIVVNGWTFERDSESILDQIVVSMSQRCVDKGVKASAADIVTTSVNKVTYAVGPLQHFAGVELFASAPGATASLAIRWTTSNGGTTPWVELPRVLAAENGWVTSIAPEFIPDFGRLGTDVAESTKLTDIQVVMVDCDATGIKAASVPVVEGDAEGLARGFELFRWDGPRPDSATQVAAAVGESNPVVAMVRQGWVEEVDYQRVEFPYVEVQWDDNTKCISVPNPPSSRVAEQWAPCFDRKSGTALLKFSVYTEGLYAEEIGGM